MLTGSDFRLALRWWAGFCGWVCFRGFVLGFGFCLACCDLTGWMLLPVLGGLLGFLCVCGYVIWFIVGVVDGLVCGWLWWV